MKSHPAGRRPFPDIESVITGLSPDDSFVIYSTVTTFNFIFGSFFAGSLALTFVMYPVLRPS